LENKNREGRSVKQKVLDKIRECIRTGFYEMTFHADDEMVNDDLDILDIEHSIAI